MENTIVIFAVSSLRDYGNGEVYFGTDGVFSSRPEAEKYIRQDIKEIVGEYEETYEAMYGGDRVPKTEEYEPDDFTDFCVEIDGNMFRWRIDTLMTDELAWKKEDK